MESSQDKHEIRNVVVKNWVEISRNERFSLGIRVRNGTQAEHNFGMQNTEYRTQCQTESKILNRNWETEYVIQMSAENTEINNSSIELRNEISKWPPGTLIVSLIK